MLPVIDDTGRMSDGILLGVYDSDGNQTDVLLRIPRAATRTSHPVHMRRSVLISALTWLSFRYGQGGPVL